MSRALTPPSAGQPIRASFFAELLREIRANRIVNGPGYRLRRTPNGTALEIQANAARSSARLPGCFEYRAPGTNSAADQGGYDNPYYMVGSRLYRAMDEDVDVSPSPHCISYLKVTLDEAFPKAEVQNAIDFATLQQIAEGTPDAAIFPLYQFNYDKKPQIDLRNIPTLNAHEFNQ